MPIPETLDFSHDKMVEMLGWPHFKGFVGDKCGNCLKTANVIHDSGWFCLCGTFNILPYSIFQLINDNPDYGPPGEAIINAIGHWEVGHPSG
jgi:hypothetical protein